MKEIQRRCWLVSCLLLLIAVLLWPSTSVPAQESPRWFKGNTHTHTLNSDGDSTPAEVTQWYREHGYNFLVLSDHNYLTSVDGLNAVYGAPNQFIVIPGEEVTDRYLQSPVHINGLNLEELVNPQGGNSVADTIQRNVDAIRNKKGIPHINHPNFHWAISAADLSQVHRYKLFEIYNGHPSVNNLGGGGMPGLEEMWDEILSGGKEVYGIAVDDAHHFKRPWDANASRPGRGWVMVRAEHLDATAIFDAMENGDFYASTGVELEDYRVTSQQMEIRIRERSSSRYRTEFIGRGGNLLAESFENPAVYRFQGNELYVRARVLESNGAIAWCQPFFVGSQ